MGNTLRWVAGVTAPAVVVTGLAGGLQGAQAASEQAPQGVASGVENSTPTHNGLSEQIRRIATGKDAGSVALNASFDGDVTNIVCANGGATADFVVRNYTEGIPQMTVDEGLDNVVNTYVGPSKEKTFTNVSLPQRLIGQTAIFSFKADGGEYKIIQQDICKASPSPSVSETATATPSPSVSESPSATASFSPSPEVSASLPPVTPTPTDTITTPPAPRVLNQKIEPGPKKLTLGKASKLDSSTDMGTTVVWDSKTKKWCKIINKGGKPAVKATSKKAVGENCVVIGKAPGSESDDVILQPASRKTRAKITNK